MPAGVTAGMRPEVLLTFDIDWSPDWMIDEVSAMLVEGRVKSTWFVTHASPAIDRLRKRDDLYELGIHPNCLPGSSHGSNEREVMQYVKAIVPEAVSMRSHNLYQTSAFLFMAARDFGMRLESNAFLPGAPGIVTSDLRSDDIAIRRAPIFWADDLAMRDPQNTWREATTFSYAPGLKVFDFHPLHVVANANDYSRYESMKRQRSIPDWTLDFVKPYRSQGHGSAAVLKNLIAMLSGQPTLFMKELLDAEPVAAHGEISQASRQTGEVR